MAQDGIALSSRTTVMRSNGSVRPSLSHRVRWTRNMLAFEAVNAKDAPSFATPADARLSVPTVSKP